MATTEAVSPANGSGLTAEERAKAMVGKPKARRLPAPAPPHPRDSNQHSTMNLMTGRTELNEEEVTSELMAPPGPRQAPDSNRGAAGAAGWAGGGGASAGLGMHSAPLGSAEQLTGTRSTSSPPGELHNLPSSQDELVWKAEMSQPEVVAGASDGLEPGLFGDEVDEDLTTELEMPGPTQQTTATARSEPDQYELIMNGDDGFDGDQTIVDYTQLPLWMGPVRKQGFAALGSVVENDELPHTHPLPQPRKRSLEQDDEPSFPRQRGPPRPSTATGHRAQPQPVRHHPQPAYHPPTPVRGRAVVRGRGGPQVRFPQPTGQTPLSLAGRGSGPNAVKHSSTLAGSHSASPGWGPAAQKRASVAHPTAEAVYIKEERDPLWTVKDLLPDEKQPHLARSAIRAKKLAEEGEEPAWIRWTDDEWIEEGGRIAAKLAQCAQAMVELVQEKIRSHEAGMAELQGYSDQLQARDDRFDRMRGAVDKCLVEVGAAL